MTRTARLLLRSSIVLIVLAVVIAGLYLWRGAGSAKSAAAPYLTAPVVRGTLERTVSSTGTLAAVETVTVGTEVSGTVAKVLVDFNSKVTKGEIMAVLKPDLFNAAVADAGGTVTQTEAGLAQAEADLERNRPLFDQGYLAAQEFLPYQTARDKARAGLVSARAGLARARTNLGNATIRSPIAGTVIQRSIDAGQTVAASLNTPTLFIIAKDLARMQIEAAVDETDIGQIQPGQPVRFSVQSYPERTFTGSVRQVRLQPTTVQNVVTYTVIVEAANDDKVLLPGMTATVDFVVERVEGAFLVPNAALRFKPTRPGGETAAPDAEVTGDAATGKGRPRGPRLFTVTAEGRLEPHQVTAGSSNGQQTVVTGDDLKEGLSVVTGVNAAGSKPKASFSLFGAMRGRPSR